MKIHEYQAIELFRKAGLPVAGGRVASDLTEAKAIVKATGFPVVLKAQVLTGGRGKAGGVKLARDAAELETGFAAIKVLNIKGYTVEKILVVQAVDIKKEFYAAVTVDNAKNDVVLIVSPEGGVDIEETAKTSPEKIFKFYLNDQKELDLVRWPEFVRKIFAEPASQESATSIFRGLLKVFFDNDCSLAEINPLVIDSAGRWLALDAKINLDDNALYRHPEFLSLRDMAYEDPDEITAKEKNLSFVKMEGSVGCIVNGAGLAMATMDVIKLLGGEPANFLDVGGSSSPEKVLHALKIILKNKDVKSILINIFGGITRCDDIARGILQAREQLEIPVPLVVRLTGTNEEEAKQILKENGLGTYPSMREAVEEAVELAK
jgi:succinyl-CoA synthetase beta subunit